MLERVSLDQETLTLPLGGSTTLQVNITPDTLARQVRLTWETDNPDVVSVNEIGKLTALYYGEATISVTVTYQDISMKANCLVSVPPELLGVSLDRDTLTLTIGGSNTLQVNITPEILASQVQLNWETDNPDVVSVNEIGKLTAIDFGEAIITVFAFHEGKSFSDSCEVVVDDIVRIPDEAFREFCLENFDTNNDGVLNTSETAAVYDLKLDDKGIISLEGIQFFISLQTLSCRSNQLTTMDVSHNTALKSIFCPYNQLKSMDVSQNTALTRLICSDNQLTALDVSQNKLLTYLNCFNNQITSLDVSRNTELEMLLCQHNQLTSLDVIHNRFLTYFDCGYNQLTSLDVSRNTALTYLDCSRNQLKVLDVSQNRSLTKLHCSSTQLTSLDVSQNKALEILACQSNQLTSLDVSQNTALTDLNCSENQLDALDVSQNTALTDLNCSENQLDALDVSQNAELVYLYCTKNQLIVLDVSRNIDLEILVCGSNQLTSLDVSHNTKLRYLQCKNSPNLLELWLKTGQTIPDLRKDSHTEIKYK